MAAVDVLGAGRDRLPVDALLRRLFRSRRDGSTPLPAAETATQPIALVGRDHPGERASVAAVSLAKRGIGPYGTTSRRAR